MPSENPLPLSFLARLDRQRSMRFRHLRNWRRTNSAGVRSAAVEALGKIGPAAKDAVPTLAELAKEQFRRFRCRQGSGRDWIGGGAETHRIGEMQGCGLAFRSLHRIRHPGPKSWAADVRSAAAEALGKIGPAAKDAVPALTELLRDEDAYARSAAAEVLVKIIGPAAMPKLVELLKDKDTDVCFAAIEVIGKIGPAAKDAVPALAELLNGWGYRSACAAAEALGKIGPAAKDAVPALAELLKLRMPACVASLLRLLGGLGRQRRTRFRRLRNC